MVMVGLSFLQEKNLTSATISTAATLTWIRRTSCDTNDTSTGKVRVLRVMMLVLPARDSPSRSLRKGYMNWIIINSFRLVNSCLPSINIYREQRGLCVQVPWLLSQLPHGGRRGGTRQDTRPCFWYNLNALSFFILFIYPLFFYEISSW